jgi:hypothetical protein
VVKAVPISAKWIKASVTEIVRHLNTTLGVARTQITDGEHRGGNANTRISRAMQTSR